MSGLIQQNTNAPVTEAAPSQADHAHQHESQWFIDENVPGPGSRPEWLDPKFKSVKGVIESYKELEKKLGGSQSVPEKYDVEDFKEMYGEDSPFIANLSARAKEHKLSQEAFKGVLSELSTYQKSLLPNTDEEMKKLGDNPQRRLDTINQWATNHLSEKSLNVLGQISHTADVVEMIDELRQLHFKTSSQVPTGSSLNTEKFKPLSVAEVETEMQQNYARYQSDAAYRHEIQRKFAQAVGED